MEIFILKIVKKFVYIAFNYFIHKLNSFIHFLMFEKTNHII